MAEHGREEREKLPRFPIDQAGKIHEWEQRLNVFPRVLTLIVLTWLPIAILDGLMGNHVLISKLWVDVPLLFVGPLLILAEAPIAMRVQLAVDELEGGGIVRDADRFRKILERGMRALKGRLGRMIELVILAFVAWAAIRGLDGLDPRRVGGLDVTRGASDVAAHWFEWFSLPVLLFLRLRWAWRGLVWLVTLARISKLPLHIHPTHVDQAGGLAILGRAQESFGNVWLGISALASTTIFCRVSSGQHSLSDYYAVMAALVALEVLLALLPLVFFAPALKACRLRGLVEYESLSGRYSEKFDPRWMTRFRAEQSNILGNPDFQSLADLGNSYDRIGKMRTFPAKATSVQMLAIFGALPFLPLALLVVPVEQIVKAVIHLVL